MNETIEKTYHIRNSEKCFRFKPDAFCSHAPPNKGIYELVTFDQNQNAKVLFVGAAFEKGILASLGYAI
jgi:uracil-DNA glycosylase